ncbi:MAG: NAD kinase [Bacteroidota bacterium]|nr:NAD kinase [Bacteroidota bacterium]
MKIAIYGRRFNQSFNGSIIQIFEMLKKNKIKFCIYRPFATFIKEKLAYEPACEGLFNHPADDWNDIDMVFSIGGDGTFLETVNMIKDKGIPILGINSGRLGFLSYVSKNEIPRALEQVLQGEYKMEQRSLLETHTEMDDFGDNNFAMNEIALQKHVSPSMIKINAFYDDELINTYWSDGLIVSTPTGSSAYSLSCGGPIVHPNSNNFVITPIAPHNLTVRPLVISDEGTIKLKLEGTQKSAKLSLDYRSVHRTFFEEIIIKKANFSINLVKLFNNNYFSTLQKKLMWGVDMRNY